MGYDCYDIIDSRDLKLKCDHQRYICKSCGSCCEQCAKNNPNGSCPKCRRNLNVFQKNNERFVYCSASREGCDFNIKTDDLSKRFYSQYIKVINIGNNTNYNKNDRKNYNSYDDENLPF